MQKTLFLTHDFNDPEFNLASEEYLLKNKEESFIYFWVNAPSVIVGVNQNALEEVNLSFLEEKGIKIVRRLTGGGAVYHDLNNLNYTVIAPYKDGEHDFKPYAYPIIEYLRKIGLNADFSGRNDIEIDGKKISGNAQTVYNGRVLHHGTLLFKTDLQTLNDALKPSKLKTQSKGIKSVRARVTNISENLKDLSFSRFKNGICDYFLSKCEKYQLTKEDIEEINKLKKEKYSTYEWNIGNSPKASNYFEEKFDFGVIKISFDIIDGLMQNVCINGDFFTSKPIEEFSKTLNGVKWQKASVMQAFKGIEEYIYKSSAKEIVDKLFL